jgi:hypothetical protein
MFDGKLESLGAAGQVFGLVGHASWQTYLAASYLLPVIEIADPRQPRDLLSKWRNPHYYVVEDESSVDEVMEKVNRKLGKL